MIKLPEFCSLMKGFGFPKVVVTIEDNNFRVVLCNQAGKETMGLQGADLGVVLRTLQEGVRSEHSDVHEVVPLEQEALHVTPNLLDHPYEVLYFGAWSETQRGHSMWDKRGRSVRYDAIPQELAGGNLDCGDGFTPTRYERYKDHPQPLGVVKTQQVIPAAGGLAWTVMSMWDRSADPRGNCNAHFLVVGIFSTDEMWQLAARDFPHQVKRIREYKE